MGDLSCFASFGDGYLAVLERPGECFYSDTFARPSAVARNENRTFRWNQMRTKPRQLVLLVR